MLKGLLKKGILKDLGNVLQIFKDNKGRFSSKRTVAGVMVATGATIAGALDLEALTVAQALLVLGINLIAASILIFSPVVEKHTKDEYPQNEN